MIDKGFVGDSAPGAICYRDRNADFQHGERRKSAQIDTAGILQRPDTNSAHDITACFY
jgi:hypothetical protein